MNHAFRQQNGGTSLIELILATGIMGLIVLGATTFFKRTQSAEYERRAKSEAVSEMNLYLRAIERDFKLRDIHASKTAAAICPDKCNRFNIQYPAVAGASSTDISIGYETRCAAIPSGMTSKFSDPVSHVRFDFTKSVDDGDLGGQGVCFRLADCKGETYPQIQISLTAPSGAQLPSYPHMIDSKARFPDLDERASAAAHVIGAAICAESKIGASSAGADRITIEAAYINAEGRFRIEKREVSIPRGNVAKIQILPSQ
jgi:type II secretory pathway pseudopilin PulG